MLPRLRRIAVALTRPSHSLLPPFPPTPRHVAFSLGRVGAAAGVAAVGAAVVGAMSVGAAGAAAAAVNRLRRRAVAVVVGAAAVGVAVAGVVGNLWIKKAGCRYISLARGRVGGDWNARDLPLVIPGGPRVGKIAIVSFLRILAAKGAMVSSIVK
jgi:hypothetical protein